jgi:cell division septum initiation protein DivIVA
MNQTDLINEYINQLSTAYKQTMVDNVMLKTQITLLTKQVEELTEKLQKATAVSSTKKKKEEVPSEEFAN